jgi:hypothetical protein
MDIPISTVDSKFYKEIWGYWDCQTSLTRKSMLRNYGADSVFVGPNGEIHKLVDSNLTFEPVAIQSYKN